MIGRHHVPFTRRLRRSEVHLNHLEGIDANPVFDENPK